MLMKKTLMVCLLSGIFIFLLGIVSPLTFKAEAKNNECTTIQSGDLKSSAGDTMNGDTITKHICSMEHIVMHIEMPLGAKITKMIH